MAEPFLGEIRLFTFGYCPKGWAACDGSLMTISQNSALYSLLGTSFGGNGTTNFALPDLRGRVPIHVGPVTGGRGAAGGVEEVTLTPPQLPAHMHLLNGSGNTGTLKLPGTDYMLATAVMQDGSPFDLYTSSPPSTRMGDSSIGQTGASQPHPNVQPSLALNFCIALSGIFPSRS